MGRPLPTTESPAGHRRVRTTASNRLQVEEDPGFGARGGVGGAHGHCRCSTTTGSVPTDVDLVVANPLTPAFLDGLAASVGIGADRFVAVEGAEHVHTAALLVALAAADDRGRLAGAHRVLLVSAGAGIVVGAALLTRDLQTG